MRNERFPLRVAVRVAVMAVAVTGVGLDAARVAAQEAPPKFLISYDSQKPPKDDGSKRTDIYLRPNTQQTVSLFIANSSEDRKQYNITLSKVAPGGQIETVASALDVKLDGKETKLIPFAKPKEQTAPLGLGAPPFQLQLTVREVRKGKELAPLVVRMSVELMTPSQYVTPRAATYDSEKKRVTVRLRANADFSGPPCRVELVLRKDVLPGLATEPGGTLQGELRKAGDELVLFADDVDFKGLPPKNGRVYVTVDGYERALMYKSTFDQGDLERLKPQTRLRILAPRYAKPGGEFRVTVEADGELSTPARLEVALDRGNEREERFDPVVFPGLREQNVTVAMEQGGLVLKTTVQDWKVALDTARVDGLRKVRARLLDGYEPANPEKELRIANEQDEKAETIPLFQDQDRDRARLSFTANNIFAHMVLDGSKPLKVQITSAPDKHRRGAPLLVKAKGSGKSAPITEVVFFVGEPDKDGKPPKDKVPAKFDPAKNEWSATLEFSKDQKSPVEVYVCFTNAVGLSELDKRVIRLIDQTSGGSGTAISGTVARGATGQPGVKVLLKDAKGMAKAEAVTDDDGKYRFEGVAPGSYVVHAEKSFSGTGRTRAQATVVVVEGKEEVAGVNLSLIVAK